MPEARASRIRLLPNAVRYVRASRRWEKGMKKFVLTVAFSVVQTLAMAQPGTWTQVTPANVNLIDPLDCDSFGTQTVVVDPNRPSDFYAAFDCQGIWKSTDFGQTWTGPINTGTGAALANGAGGIAISAGLPGQPPVLHYAGIRGSGGFYS